MIVLVLTRPINNRPQVNNLHYNYERSVRREET
jgi:hypothetical protein